MVRGGPSTLLNIFGTTNPCSVCIEAAGGWYFCNTQCNSWFQQSTQCDCGGVHAWNYVPPELTFFVGRHQNLTRIRREERIPFFGLELEIEAQLHSSSRSGGAALTRDMVGQYGWCMHDGSLLGNKSNGTGGEKGFEFVTYPFTFEWYEENWWQFERWLAEMRSRGYRAWDGGRCGMHIHVSRAPMTDAHQMKFIRMIYGSTNLMMAIGGRGYKDKNLSKFSPFHREDRSNLLMKVRNFTNPGVDGHYTAINTNKAATLEARWFRGTLNPDSIRKNIELMDAMWWFTREYGFVAANEMNFIQWLRDPMQHRKYNTLLSFIERNYITRR
jgi:hypothetical protein